MGAKDEIVTPYFENPEVFCSFINGAVFQGRQVLRPEHLSELPREVIAQLPWSRNGKEEKKTVIRDTVKLVYLQTVYVIFICENQSEIHYGMPIRMLLYDAVQYGEQMRKKQKENKEAGSLKTPAEYLSGIHKGEKFLPVVSVVFYYGEKPWDGPVTLEEMIDLPEGFEELKEFLPTYKMHLVEPGNIDPDSYSGDWKTILEVLRLTGDPKALAEYAENHEGELEKLSEESQSAMLAMLGEKRKLKKREEESNMLCTAFREFKEEAKKEAKKEIMEEAMGKAMEKARKIARKEAMEEARKEVMKELKQQKLEEMVQSTKEELIIKIKIEGFQEIGADKKLAMEKIKEIYSLTQEDAENYFDSYWK